MTDEQLTLELRYELTLTGYQRQAAEYATGPASQCGHTAITYCTLGLVGEAGEVAEKLKKVLRDQDGEFGDVEFNVGITEETIALELGDVLWYVARLADRLGYTLDRIAKMNLEKLRSRKTRGVIRGSGDER